MLSVNRIRSSFAASGILLIIAQTCMGARTWLDGGRPCLRRERILTSLHHKVRNVAEHSCLDDLPLCNPVEFTVSKHDHPHSWANAEPWVIEKPHEMAHFHHPGAFEAIKLVAPRR